MTFKPTSPRSTSAPAHGRPVLAGLAALLLAASLAAAQDAAPDAGGDPGYQVVVHADNPTDEIAADTVAKMFRKKVKRWDHDVTVTPVDLAPESPIRKAFTRGVHKKSVTAIQSYWLRMIFSGRDEPPEAKVTEDEVLAVVSADPGAIGYVSATKALDDGVRKLKITP